MRHAKFIAVAIAASAILLGGIVPGRARAAQPAEDRRTLITLDEYARATVLAEMRAMLSSLQEIIDGLARGDMRAVVNAARASGMQGAADVDPKVQAQLPEAFKKLGFSMHTDFDALAATAESAPDAGRTLAQLGSTLQKCVACHAAYQIRVGR